MNDIIYFKDYKGLIQIICKECGFKETIYTFSLGYSTVWENDFVLVGYQCQMCGKFLNRDYYPGLTTIDNLTCKCGGELLRDKPIFCPKCQGLHFDYRHISRIA